MSYEYPEHRGFCRKLSLDLIESADAEVLNRRIRAVWVPPPVPQLPETLEVFCGWPLRVRIALDANQFTLHRGEQRYSCRWDEIARLEVWRTEHDLANFRDAVIHIPSEVLRIPRNVSMNVPLATCIGVLCRHVPKDRIIEIAMSGPARTAAEANARIQWLDQRIDGMRSGCWVFGGLMVLQFAMAVAFAADWLRGLVFVPLYALLGWALKWMLSEMTSSLESQRRDLQNQRRFLGESSSP
jgi:hypothetical protein